MADTAPWRVAIVVFDDVEVLDACGPFEVFSVAGYVEGKKPFSVRLVAETGGAVRARNGLRLLPDHDYADCPEPDIVVVPGGPGARPQSRDAALREWLKRTIVPQRTVLSVCTGALILGRAGYLDGLDVTTHHMALDELREAAPDAVIHDAARYLWNDNILVAAGVSSGIDASLEIVARFCGEDMARSTARYMEYPWNRE